jgi:hypothetical protein
MEYLLQTISSTCQSSRTIYPELIEATKIIAEKDGKIQRLTKEKEELVKQLSKTAEILVSSLCFIPLFLFL